jgi:formylglycine-generating enzyme required for sulfatase activity
MAYTVAGAFVDYIGQNYGKSTVRAWYRGQSLERITGKKWPELEASFQAYLRKIDVPEDALNAARARFARPGLFTRRCPHAVDRAIETAERQLYQGNAKTACRFYERALELDPTEISARFGLGECSRRDQDSERAELAFRKIITDLSLPQSTRERAEEQLADLFFEQEKPEKYQTIYQKLAQLTLETDRRRTLEIKASARSRHAITAIKSLLIGKNGEKAWDVAVRDLLLWSQSEPQNGLPDYLLARNFWNQGREAVAVEHLDRALGKSVELADVLAEAYRLRATMACAQNDVPTATKLAERLSQNQTLTEPRRLGILRLVERCAGRRVGDDWPETREPAKVLGPLPGIDSTPVGASRSSSSNSLPWNTTQFECPNGMVKIPGETFWMGSKRGYNADDETPRFQTQVRGFCLDETEVTVEMYRECVKTGTCTAAQSDSSTCNYTHNDRLKHPINCVNYEQSENYCRFRNARLPTEIEWEFAARGGAQALKYPWGEGSPDGRACWKNHMTCPVKTFAGGAYGLFDMTGNVWEWTSSEYSPYPFPGLSDDNSKRVYRGGSWSRRFEKWMHIGLRNRWGVHEQGSHLGLRCATSASGASCPMGADEKGHCYPVILAAECPPLQTWNGFRCAPTNAPECEDGLHADRMHGCIRDIPLVFHDHLLDTQAVKRQRSPEFDADCRENQPKRPVSYRYFGGEHDARNLVSRQAGCKNRDVGAGWNSTCCP